MAGGNSVSAATVRRWVLEVIDLLAARAPRLDRGAEEDRRPGRCGGPAGRHPRAHPPPHRGGKHKAHGLHFLALTDEKGNLIWISSARPGRASEITAARHDHSTTHLREVSLGALADLGFVVLDDDPTMLRSSSRAARRPAPTASPTLIRRRTGGSPVNGPPASTASRT